MGKIVEIKFGSHLYGTNTEKSDLDIKGVFLPDAKNIILQDVQNSICNRRPKKEGEKNYAGEVDSEFYSLSYYLKLLLEGQTVCLDMLFAPKECLIYTTKCWKFIVDNRDKFVSKKSAAFIGYCRQQANKYGIKGSRVASVRLVYEIIEKHLKDHDQLLEFGWNRWLEDTNTPHCRMHEMLQPGGHTYVHFIEVCGKSFALTAKAKLAKDCLRKVLDGYGNRSLQAERNEGVDWKALSHAVRVATQAIQLFKTGEIIFPLENRKHILDIKLGNINYKEVAEEIEQLLLDTEEESKRSNLRDYPDYQFAQDFILSTYSDVCNHPGFRQMVEDIRYGGFKYEHN